MKESTLWGTKGDRINQSTVFTYHFSTKEGVQKVSENKDNCLLSLLGSHQVSTPLRTTDVSVAAVVVHSLPSLVVLEGTSQTTPWTTKQ